MVSEGSDQPLAGAQILVVGTEQRALSDAEGRFVLRGLVEDEVTLQVTMLGYRTATERISTGTMDLRVMLAPRALALDEIVVTGTPGGAQARAIGNAVAQVSASELVEIAPPPDVQEMLSAQVPGLRIQRAGGAIGVGGNTRVRGVASVELSGEPLVYVDGVRVDNDASFGSPAFSRGDQPSRINDFNPEEIERIEVIKGPAAATLYGTEASNGVIQIFTKRGEPGAPSFEARITQGANFLRSPATVFPSAWGLHPQTGELYEHNVLRDEAAAGRSPFQTGWSQGYGLSMRGGTDAVQYFVSGNFDRDEGIVSYNWQNKLGTRANLTYVADVWDINANLGIVQQRTRSPNVVQPFPVVVIWNLLNGIGDPELRGYRRNPPEDFEDLEGYEDVHRTTGNVTVKHRPFPWLNHRLTIGRDVGSIEGSSLIPRHPDGDQGPWSGQSLGEKSVTHYRTIHQSVDYAATASVDAGRDLNLSTSVGAQFYEKETATTAATGEVFPAPGVETVSAAATRFGDEQFLENKTVGLFVQEQLGWKNRLFLTGALRGDDNSAFGANYDFVVYPKVSASWVVSEEPFWRLAQVDQLRLRGAWGRAGQQPDAFAAIRLLSPSVGPGGSSTLTLGNMGNPDLEPEVGEEIELGVDASLFDQRLVLEFTYYNQRTKGALVARPALPSLGFPGSQLVNLGEVANAGTELGLRYQLLRSDDLGLDLGLTFSTNRNELVDAGGVDPGGALQRNVEGYPLQAIFQKKVVHAEFDADGNPTNVLCEGGDPVTGGGPAVPCDEAGTAYWGPVTPTWEGSASATLRYGAFRLFGLVDFVGGHYRIDGDIHFAHTFYQNTEAVQKRNDPILAAYMETGISGRQPGTIKGGFAKLRSISATYDVPASWAGLIGAQDASITLSGQNLGTLWLDQAEGFGRKQVEPEIRSNSGELNAYNQEKWPMFTQILTTVRITF